MECTKPQRERRGPRLSSTVASHTGAVESTVVKLPSPGQIGCDVRDLASLLPASARDLRWRLADGHEPTEVLMTLESFEKGNGPFPEGPMDHRWMLVWWTRQLQSLWGIYLAAIDDATLLDFEAEYLDWIAPDALRPYPFALQAVDGGFWLIHSTDKDFLQRLERDHRAERMPYRPRRRGS